MKEPVMRLNHLFAIAPSLLVLTMITHPQPVPAAGLDAVATGNNEFALSLYSQLKSAPSNLFFSPYSISTCLAMTYAGARGQTEQQMAQVLHFGTQQQLHVGFGQLQKELAAAASHKGIQLTIANALWTQQGFAFLPDFLNTAKDEYAANLNQANFATDAEKARGTINHWVAEQTKEKIQDILPAGSVNGATRLVLANAIYFKGIWAKPYDKNQTAEQPFHLSASKSSPVPLMHHLDAVRYAENEEIQAVELPYQSNQLAMVVLLPRQVEGVAALEGRLTATLLNDTLRQMRSQKVDIFLPRFKLESRFKLNEPLEKLGMRDAFGSSADLSGIDGKTDLFISGLFHKAWGEVNEEGTEAAAATAGTIALTSVAPVAKPPPVFRADHPFLFLIRDTRSGSILFLGRLADPGK
jgi:serpin B